MVNQDFTGDESLLQFALEAQQYPENSSGRQQALQKMMQGIMNSGKLGHPQAGKYSQDIYQDLYHEALGKTMLRLCKSIDLYNPAHPVMAWVNEYLNYAFIDVEKDRYRVGMTYIPKYMKKEKITTSLDDLSREPPAPAGQIEAKRVRQFLYDDPEGLLHKVHIHDHPEATFQRLAIQKHVDDLTWKMIGQEFDIAVPTLSSFFKRTLKKLEPYFRKYLSD